MLASWYRRGEPARLGHHRGRTLSESCTYEANGLPAWKLSGREEVLGRFKALLAAFPDQKASIKFLVAEEDRAAYELHITETHTDALETPFGTFAATGMAIDEVVGYFVELDQHGSGQ
jgi:hypothetical protein